MQSDSAVRALLGLILLCLVLLVVRGFLPDTDGEAGRYKVTAIRAGSPLLVRIDSATGRTWRLELSDRRVGRSWELFLEPGESDAGARDAEAAEGSESTGPADPESDEASPPAAAPAARAPKPLQQTPPAPASAVRRVPPEASARRGVSAGDIAMLADSLRSDVHPDLRVWAAQQLGTLRSAEAIPPLILALRDPEPAVAVAAVEALAASDDPRARAALESVADHPDPDVRNAVRGAQNAAD